MLVEVALIKLTRPSMEPNLDAILQRLGCDTLFNQTADCFSVRLCVGKPHYISVIINTEKQCATNTVCKGADAF